MSAIARSTISSSTSILVGPMELLDNTDADDINVLITDLGGCGRFQLVITFSIMLVKVMAAMSMMMMAFGNYNPGWICQDNDVTQTGTNLTPTVLNESTNGIDQCRVYEHCKNVEFISGVQTVLTEWQLLCDKSWILSLIISIQMLGVLIGSYIAGYIADRFGRKPTVYAATVYQIVFNIVAIFSNSWQMFLVMRFFIGLGIPVTSNTPVVLTIEFVTPKWRNAIMCFPFWPLGGLLFALTAITTEDWRYLHGINAAAYFIALLPCYWMPESVRWLVTKGKVKDAFGIVKTIARVNGAKEQRMGRLQRIENRLKSQMDSDDYTCFYLFRKDVRKPTIIIGLAVISFSMTYYAISFGAKSLPGNLYMNLVLMYVTEFAFSLVSSFLPNYTGRRVAIIIYLILCTTGLFVIVGLDLRADGDLKTIGIIVSVLIVRSVVDSAWDILVTYTLEFYPTVIRSTSVAYGSLVARVGGILAPYLVPDDTDTFFINYLIMAVLSLASCGLVSMLQETKGKPLEETWIANEPDSTVEDKSTEPVRIDEQAVAKA